MKPSGIPSHETARQRLLEEGASSYLEAATAVVAYEREVQKGCQRVMEKYVDDYASVLRLQPKLRSNDIRSGVWPKSEQWEENWRTVGAEIVRRNVTSTLSWWSAYCYVVWQLEDPRLYCWVGEYYSSRAVAANLFQKFRRLNPRVVTVDENEVGVREILKDAEGATFEEKLEGLFEQWVKLWKNVGGIKAVFKK